MDNIAILRGFFPDNLLSHYAFDRPMTIKIPACTRRRADGLRAGCIHDRISFVTGRKQHPRSFARVVFYLLFNRLTRLRSSSSKSIGGGLAPSPDGDCADYLISTIFLVAVNSGVVTR